MIPNQAQLRKQFIEELQTNPLIQVACQKLGVKRATYYRWTKEHKEFKKKCNEARKISTPIINDLAETCIINKIKDGDLKASIFWLNNNHPKYIKNNMRHAKLQMLLDQKQKEIMDFAESKRDDIRELIELAKKFPPIDDKAEIS